MFDIQRDERRYHADHIADVVVTPRCFYFAMLRLLMPVVDVADMRDAIDGDEP